MKSHDFARKLLELPDLDLVILGTIQPFTPTIQEGVIVRDPEENPWVILDKDTDSEWLAKLNAVHPRITVINID